MINILKNNITLTIPAANHKNYYFVSTNSKKQKFIAEYLKDNNAVLLTEWIYQDNKNKNTYWVTLYLFPDEGIYCIQSPLSKKFPVIHDLSEQFPVCNRLQRAIYELTGIPCKNATDKRFWLNHGHFPLGILNDNSRLKPTKHDHYGFNKVAGDAVHEIPVGPVHAGIIEPGHFRFSVVGERVIYLEERLGYVHKGIHKLLKNKSIEDAAKLLGRVSGDSTVAYSLAFAKACEQVCQYPLAENSIIERCICLERERLANHIGDLAAIVNDAGMPSLQAAFSCLKEQLLGNNKAYLGHRYLMDCIIPFAQKSLFSNDQLQAMQQELLELNKSFQDLQKIVAEHIGLHDRLHGTGLITNDRAKQLGLLGVAAKASGIDCDLRRLLPDITHGFGAISSCGSTSGDAAARVDVRIKESNESMQLIAELIHLLDNRENQPHTNRKAKSPEQDFGIGIVEGWRGPVTVIAAVEDSQVRWCHFHDPSWQNWLALPYAVLNNIVADFPLINKSFNLSYSGVDS